MTRVEPLDKQQTTMTNSMTTMNDYDEMVGEYVDYSFVPARPPPPRGLQKIEALMRGVASASSLVQPSDAGND